MRTAFYLAFLRLRRAPLRFCLVLLTIIVTVCIALWFAAGYDTLMANADRDAAVMTGSADLLLFPRRTAASSLDEGMRAKLDALSQTNEARALSELFSDAELARASQSGDEQALRSILKRVLATGEGKRLAQMLGDAMK